jgi:signal transduction histidine kinase
LLDNAGKFGPPQREIRVNVTDVDGWARISVQDQGPGIPEAEQEKVWDAFYRMKREESTAIGGTGIGLSVVRELVESMQGRCVIDSGDGGTRVSVEFQSGADHE